MNFQEGLWHAICELPPQYEHMAESGGTGYADYMRGWNAGQKKPNIPDDDDDIEMWI